MATELETLRTQAFNELAFGDGTGLLVLADYLEEQGEDGEFYKGLGFLLQNPDRWRMVDGSRIKYSTPMSRDVQRICLESMRLFANKGFETLNGDLTLSSSAAVSIASTREVRELVLYSTPILNFHMTHSYGLPAYMYGQRVTISDLLPKGWGILGSKAPYEYHAVLIHSIC